LLRAKLRAEAEQSGAKYRSVLEKSSSCAAHFFSSVFAQWLCARESARDVLREMRFSETRND